MSRGLFKATKRKRRVSAAEPELFADLATAEKPADAKAARVAKDHYPTGDAEAILSLLAVDGARIRESGNVWEPACGKGDLVHRIRAFGIPCCASDIEDYGCPDSWTADFYSCLKSRGGAIITNPPFNEINAGQGHGRWLRHTLDMPGWDYLALLLDWGWPAARANGLGALLDARPFSYCYLMRWRLDFTGQGSAPQKNAWFIWDRRDVRGYGPGQTEPGFRFLDRTDPRQEGLFDGRSQDV